MQTVERVEQDAHANPLSSRWGAVGAAGALLGGLLLLNAWAIREIIDARHEARRLARHDLELRLEERRQALLGRLANLRTDLVALAESAPFQELPERLASSDPLVQRWARLDAEGSLLLFAQSRNALRRLRLSTGAGTDPVVVGRWREVAAILAPRDVSSPDEEWVTTRVSLPAATDAWLRGWIDPALLLAEPGFEGLTLEPAPPGDAAGSGMVAAVKVEDSRWEPPIRGWLVARQEESQVERSVGALAQRYRRTVIWNLVVIVAVSAAVVLALLQLRRRVRAEAAAGHERRVRELERGLLHSERLASVGRFAAGIAHEVNNPLEGMGNYLSLLNRDIEAGDTEAARGRVQRVREGLERAAAIVRRVLTFSDPARSPKEIVRLVEPLREAVDFLQPRFPEVEMEIVGSGGAAEVHGNRVALGQLFLNILLNACEGQEGGGRVGIRLAEDDSAVTVTIADRGPGLSEEALDHIFEPFYSTRGSSGLGLAVCHGIVRDHGGEIGARNVAGGPGAVFEVRLPRAEPQRRVAEA